MTESRVVQSVPACAHRRYPSSEGAGSSWGGEQPKVAVDIDDVLFDFVSRFLQWHDRRYRTNLRFEDVVFGVQLWEVWGGTKEETVERIPSFFREVDLLNLEPIAGAVEVLRKLKGTYQLAVVSARDNTVAPLSRAWIDKYFTDVFDEVVLGIANPYAQSRPIAKSELCRRIGASIMIDDELLHAAGCAQAGIRALLFGDYPWNQAETLPPNVVRVANWDDVCRVLLGST